MIECLHKKLFDYVWPDVPIAFSVGRFAHIPPPYGDVSRHCAKCGKEVSRRRDGEDVPVQGIVLTLKAARSSVVGE